MNTYDLRHALVKIAAEDVGQTESSRNRGPAMKKFWPATDYPEGYANREPYCAAACCYWLREWLKMPKTLSAMGMTPAQADKWRCKSAAAFGWLDWASKKGLAVYSDDPRYAIHTGDIMVFDMSHIGIVVDDYPSRGTVATIEANTGPSGGRDGDGVWEKVRARSLARMFIRLLP